MNLLVSYLGMEAVFQFGDGTIGYSQGIVPGATANQVAVESVLWARSKGVDLFKGRASVVARSAKKCKLIMSALELSKHVEFNSESTDILDFKNEDTKTTHQYYLI